jgi:type IV secretion system protein VirB11
MDERLLESLEYNCGDLIMGPLRDASVIEIMLNPDGRLWIEKYGQEQECIGDLPLAQGRLILSLVASALGQTVDALHPVVEGSFPLDGSRFEGTFPPLVGPGASFSLRKKASRVITMREYLGRASRARKSCPSYVTPFWTAKTSSLWRHLQRPNDVRERHYS